jgi:hypothetical protein
MPAKDKRRKKDRTGSFDWNLTNIGAFISMVGFLHFIFIIFMYLLLDVLIFILVIPAMVLLVVGYALIVKDHFDGIKKKKALAAKRISTPEEE